MIQVGLSFRSTRSGCCRCRRATAPFRCQPGMRMPGKKFFFASCLDTKETKTWSPTGHIMPYNGTDLSMQNLKHKSWQDSKYTSLILWLTWWGQSCWTGFCIYFAYENSGQSSHLSHRNRWTDPGQTRFASFIWMKLHHIAPIHILLEFGLALFLSPSSTLQEPYNYLWTNL